MGLPRPAAARRDRLRGHERHDRDDAVIQKARWLKDVGEAAPAYDRLWPELKAG